MCQRRGVSLSKIESVAFNVRCNFGLADGTALLPAGANTFYLCRSLSFYQNGLTGVPRLEALPNAGVGSSGTPTMFISNTATGMQALWNVECDNLLYYVNSHSAGSIYIFGEVYKITTA